jgi:hypothetical protein
MLLRSFSLRRRVSPCCKAWPVVDPSMANPICSDSVRHWTSMSLLNSADLPKYLTDDAVGDLVTLLLASRTSSEVAQLARRHGWEPIISAAKAAGNEFRRDYHYEVAISRHSDPRYYDVETDLTLERTLRPDHQHYVRFGRTANAVRERLTDDAMLGVELVPVPPAEWTADEVTRSLTAKVKINKRGPVILAGPSQTVGDDAVHLPVAFPDELSDNGHRIQVTAGYVVPRGATYFPVKLANVYCLGETTINFRIDDPEVADLDAWVSLPGDVGLDTVQDGVTVNSNISGTRHSIKVETSAEVLLWPGTTVIFVWRRPEATPLSNSESN